MRLSEIDAVRLSMSATDTPLWGEGAGPSKTTIFRDKYML